MEIKITCSKCGHDMKVIVNKVVRLEKEIEMLKGKLHVRDQKVEMPDFLKGLFKNV